LNSNLFKQATAFINAKRRDGVHVELVTWGRRAKQFATKIGLQAHAPREKVLDKPTYLLAKELADDLVSKFGEGGFDRIYLGFVEFRSAMSQQAKVVQALPVGKFVKAEGESEFGPDIIVEPSLNKVLEEVLKREVAGFIFRAMLEGAASEHGARMTAMDSATNNANEVLRRMKIQYNRARQAAITKELIEITSGAQAL
jgi:F-type H+-transporting ATPase subunit gamma